MDQRAQISVEFILFAAIVLAVVLVFASVISDQSEMNSIATAAKEGATNATAQLSFLNGSMTPVRVTNINMTVAENVSIEKNVSIQIHFSGSVSGVQNKILNSVNKSITSAGYTTWYNDTSQTSIIIKTNKHLYTITLV